MARHIAWALAALLLVPASGHASDWCEKDQPPQQRGGQPPAGQPGDKTKNDDHKSAAVEDVWQKSLPKLRDDRGLLEKQEDVLSQMIAADAAEVAIVAQIDRVENMRAEVAKGRTLMIYRMNKVLTLEQRAKVKAMMERRDSGRRGPSSR
jgi:Spy/CpxP family protein refolding chaperone